MTQVRSLKQRLSRVQKLWSQERFDEALTLVEELRAAWPGNSKLLVQWASLVQLQENPTHSLAEVKEALQCAVALDEDSPAAALELGSFLDTVEDDPRAAEQAFSAAVRVAQRLLLEALVGQARALLQLNEKKGAFRCLAEALQLTDQERLPRKGKRTDGNNTFGLNDFSDEIASLLNDLLAPANGRKV
jgi:tetratricopeptide (TPR) repeat protein